MRSTRVAISGPGAGASYVKGVSRAPVMKAFASPASLLKVLPEFRKNPGREHQSAD